MTEHIIDAIANGDANITVTVKAKDLADIFARMIRNERQRIEAEAQSRQSQKCMTKKQAAEYLGVCTVTLDRLTRSGEIAYRRIRGKVMFLQSDIDKYLNANKSNAV